MVQLPYMVHVGAHLDVSDAGWVTADATFVCTPENLPQCSDYSKEIAPSGLFYFRGLGASKISTF